MMDGYRLFLFATSVFTAGFCFGNIFQVIVHKEKK